MIRAVLDSNVLISALFWRGAPYKIVQKGLGSVFVVLMSPEIIEEVKERLINKFKFPTEDTLAYLETLTLNSEMVEPDQKLDAVKTDPKDNKIIECAVSGMADYIVSGDKHLLSIKRYKEIKITAPQDFLRTIQ